MGNIYQEWMKSGGVQTMKSLKDAPPKNRERCILSIGSTFATEKSKVPTFSSEPFLCYLGLVLGLIVKIGSFFFTGRVFFRLGFGGGHDPR